MSTNVASMIEFATRTSILPASACAAGFGFFSRARIAVAMATALLASCMNAPAPSRQPSGAELASFASASTALEQLSRTIQADAGQADPGQGPCFVVGLDTISGFGPGNHRRQYWKNDDDWFGESDSWFSGSQSNTTLSLHAVLKAAVLSEDRYQTYKRLFVSTGSQSVTFCPSGDYGPILSVLVYRSGFLVHNCSAEFRYDPGEPHVSEWVKWQEVIRFNTGWSAVSTCS